MFYGRSQPRGEELKPREVGSHPADVPRSHRAEPEGLGRPSSAAATSNPEVTLPSRARALGIVTLHRSVGSMLQREKGTWEMPVVLPRPSLLLTRRPRLPRACGTNAGPWVP